MSGVAALLLLTSAAHTATLTATSCAVLDDLVASANGTDVVEIAFDGPCVLGAPLVMEGITLRPAAGYAPELQGSVTPLLEVGANAFLDAARIEDLTIRLDPGGAVGVRVAHDGAAFDGVTFLGPGSGGPAIDVLAGYTGITLTGVTVIGFGGAAPAAGLRVGSTAEATVTDSRFEGNSGPAISAEGGTLEVIRTTFCANSADYGAGIYAFGATVTVHATVLQGNVASVAGGAVYANGSTLELHNVDVVGSAPSGVESTQTVTVDSSLFFGNPGLALSAPAGSLRYNLFNGNGFDVGGGLAGLGTNARTDDPQVWSWNGDGSDCVTQDFRPELGSPLVGNGNPNFANPDIGRYGGEHLETGWDDVDGDGDPYTTDCADEDPARSATAAEICNDIDDDCDLEVDEDPAYWPTVFTDADGDGYGDPDAPAQGCDAVGVPPEVATDCNDAVSGMHPGALEVCDHVDQDCDGVIDDADPLPAWGPDGDRDGFGVAEEEGCFPSDPAHAPADPPDCDDGDPLVRPDLPEICDGGTVDNDCDGDPTDGTDAPLWYPDVDRDGHGSLQASGGSPSCEVPGPQMTPVRSDCDDMDPDVHPGATEVCDDGVDNDCDNAADDLDQELYAVPHYADADDDGAGDRFGLAWVGCGAPPDGTVANADDCDDDDPTRIAPLEYWPDADGDGHGNPEGAPVVTCTAPQGYAEQADDCNDGNPNAHPGLAEVPEDQVDNDCDGVVDDQAPIGRGSGTPTGAEPAAGCGCRSAHGSAPLGLPLLLAAVMGAGRRARSGPGGGPPGGPCSRCPRPSGARRPTAPTSSRRS